MFMKRLKRVVVAIMMLIVLIIVAVVAVLINPKLGAEEIKTFRDDPYEVIIYGYSLPMFAMPGQGGDRDGFARVYNMTSGRLLCELDVPQAGHIYDNDVRWHGNDVTFPGMEGFVGCALY